MPLQMQFESGRFRPVVVCDHCGEMIDNARSGNYQWRVDDQGRCAGEGGIFFTHKARCRAFEAARGGRRGWAWTSLSCLPVFLANNLGLDLKDAEKSAELFSAI